MGVTTSVTSAGLSRQSWPIGLQENNTFQES